MNVYKEGNECGQKEMMDENKGKEGNIVCEMKSDRNEHYITPFNHKINRATDLWTLFPVWYIIKNRKKEGKGKKKEEKGSEK